MTEETCTLTRGDRVALRGDADFFGTVLRVLDVESVLVLWESGVRLWHPARDLGPPLNRATCCFVAAWGAMTFGGSVRCVDDGGGSA